MADNAIGPLSVKAVVNPEGVTKGIDDVKRTLEAAAPAVAKSAEKAGDAWARSFRDRLTGGLGSLRDWASSGAGLFERALGNPARFAAESVGFLGQKLEALPAIGPILALPFEGLSAGLTAALDTYDKGATTIMEFGKAAQRANMDLGEFRVMAMAMGGDFDMTARAAFKFRHALTEAALAGPGANNPFTRLGLDPAALIQDERAFDKFARAVRGTGNEFIQSGYAADVFGARAAQAVMPLLNSGKLDKFRGLMEGFGAGFGARDFAMIREVKEAALQFTVMKEGFQNQITLAVAPILAELASRIPKLTDLGVTFKGLAASLLAFAEGATKLGVGLFEAFRDPGVRAELFGTFDRLMKYAGEKFSEYLLWGVGNLFRAIGKVDLGRFLGSIDLGATGQRLLRQSDTAGLAAGFNLSMAGVRWSQLMDAVGATPGGAALTSFFGGARGRAAGGPAAAIDPFAFWKAQAQEMFGGAEGVLGKGATPLDQFRQQMLRINTMAQTAPLAGPFTQLANLSALTRGASDQAVLAAYEGLRKAYSSGSGSMLSAALLQGSAAAASAVNNTRFSARDTLADLLKEGNRQAEERKKLLEQIKDELADPGVQLFLRGS